MKSLSLKTLFYTRQPEASDAHHKRFQIDRADCSSQNTLLPAGTRAPHEEKARQSSTNEGIPGQKDSAGVRDGVSNSPSTRTPHESCTPASSVIFEAIRPPAIDAPRVPHQRLHHHHRAALTAAFKSSFVWLFSKEL